MCDTKQQIYARIKRSSRYYGQGDRGELFDVMIKAAGGDEYVVHGGPGGRYRLRDVNLFVGTGEKQVRIA